MKTKRNAVLNRSAWLGVMAMVASLHMGDRASAQANSRPPERMTYQGFIAGTDGVGLGNTAPKNYDVIFRIYDGESSNTPLWGEQQTVTVDKGYFSVLLGEGAAVPGTPNAGITLSSLFNSATASDRYVGFTVKGIGTGGAEVEILPRVRFMTSPYAFLANRALGATKIIQDNAAGADLLSGSGSALTLNGRLNVLGANIVEFGSGIAGKEGAAGTISYGAWSNGDSLDIVGAGSSSNNRKVRFWNEGGAFFNGPLNVTGSLNVGPTVIRQDGGVNGIIFGSNSPKEYGLNGSILYLQGPIAGQETLYIQGGGNATATRSVTIQAEGGTWTYGPLMLQAGASGNINLGHNVTKEVNSGKIGYQLFSSDHLDITGAGLVGEQRKTRIWGALHVNEGGYMPNYPLQVGGFKDGTLIGLQVDYFARAQAFLTGSDRRAKELVGTSSHPKDLDNLRRIRVADYRWKSQPGQEGRTVKGVIAQELQPVLPEAITISVNIIPCDPIKASRIEWKGAEKPTLVVTDVEHGLKVGENIRLEVDGQPTSTSVTTVPDARSFTVSAIGMSQSPKSVALVGREVKDFLNVDYQQIYMTAVSALQEVDRRLQAVDQRVQEVEKREARMADLERKAARVENLERDVAELRKLMAAIQSGAGKGATSASAGGSSAGAVALSR